MAECGWSSGNNACIIGYINQADECCKLYYIYLWRANSERGYAMPRYDPRLEECTMSARL